MYYLPEREIRKLGWNDKKDYTISVLRRELERLNNKTQEVKVFNI